MVETLKHIKSLNEEIDSLKTENERLKACEQIAKSVSTMSCNCQKTVKDVQQNYHWASCQVGKAQALFGIRVLVERR